MKKVFSLYVVFFFFALGLNATDPDYEKDIKTSFSVSCKAMDVILIGIEDGVSKRYSGIQDVWDEYFSIGKMFNINVSFTETYMTYYLNFNIPALGIIASWDVNGIGNRDIKNVSFNKNRIFFSSRYATPYDLELERYYKDDWQFKLDGSWGNSSYIVTANCMSMPITYKEFLENIKDKNLNNGFRVNK
jgi:hypothetical protein